MTEKGKKKDAAFARRSGADRRRVQLAVDYDRRSGKDRRESSHDADFIIDCMKKIPIFSGLSDSHYGKILNICSKRIVPGDHYLVKDGDKADALYILMKGSLDVVSRHGARLASITTLGLVGEMGVFAGTGRTASVVAVDDCVVLRISRNELFDLFLTDCDLGNRILLNVIRDLAAKLQEDNTVIEELRSRRTALV